jgi:dTMP kinase
MDTDTARPHPHPGFFLALEGPDGGGKTTQTDRLVDWLRSRNFDVVACRDPGGTALGNRLRHLLLDRHTMRIGLRAEMLLYQAARAELVEEVITPALALGKIVVSDRFLLSNIVYQGAAGGLLEEEIAMVGMVTTAGVLPDLTIILDVAPEIADVRLSESRTRDRIEERPPPYRAKVRDGFLAAVGLQTAGASGPEGKCPYYPAPLFTIDASADPHEVFGQIQREVARVLALDSGP